MDKTSDFSPEQRLLLYCARLAPSCAAAAEIEFLVASDLDWNRVIAYAAWHQVTPLVHRMLSKLVPDQVPPAVNLVFDRHVQRYSAQYRLQFRELLRIVEALAAKGVPVIPFKGPALARLVYGDLSLRPFSDLDFLLHSQDVERALKALAPLGYIYQSTRTGGQERHFRLYAAQHKIGRHDGEVWIEPHWSLAQRVFAIDLDYPALWRRSVVVTWEGVQVRTFAPRDLPLVLCVHGFREQWQRLKWVCDVAELLRQEPGLDWAAILQEARATGCERLLRLGIVLAGELLDAPVPSPIFHSPDPRVEALASQVRSHLFRTGQPRNGLWTVNAFHLIGRERLRDKLRYALRAQFAPRLVFFEKVRLPDRLFFCYYPIRWIHDYLLLPGWWLWKWVRLK